MRRAFLGRRFFADKFAREEPDSRDNAPHAHFVGVLAEVVGTLAPLIHVKSASGGIEAANIDIDATPSNLFDVLAPPNNEEEGAPATPSHKDFVPDSSDSTLSTSNILYKAEVDMAEEVRLRLSCLKVYIKEGAGFVLGIWSSCFANPGSHLDLAIATLVTEFALARLDEVMWGLQADFGPGCP